VRKAMHAIENGTARAKLDEFIGYTNRLKT